jgi:hypothetical protein
VLDHRSTADHPIVPRRRDSATAAASAAARVALVRQYAFVTGCGSATIVRFCTVHWPLNAGLPERTGKSHPIEE